MPASFGALGPQPTLSELFFPSARPLDTPSPPYATPSTSPHLTPTRGRSKHHRVPSPLSNATLRGSNSNAPTSTRTARSASPLIPSPGLSKASRILGEDVPPPEGSPSRIESIDLESAKKIASGGQVVIHHGLAGRVKSKRSKRPAMLARAGSDGSLTERLGRSKSGRALRDAIPMTPSPVKFSPLGVPDVPPIPEGLRGRFGAEVEEEGRKGTQSAPSSPPARAGRRGSERSQPGSPLGKSTMPAGHSREPSLTASLATTKSDPTGVSRASSLEEAEEDGSMHKLSIRNRRKLRKQKTESDVDTVATGGPLHMSASMGDLPTDKRRKSIGAASMAASVKSNKSVASAISGIGKKTKTMQVPKLPWFRPEKGENHDDLMASGFFERTTLPPIKMTRLPVLTMSSLDINTANTSGKAVRGSMVLTPTGFYDGKRNTMRFSWNVKADAEDGEGTKTSAWIPANRFSWAIREKDGIPDPVKDSPKRMSKKMSHRLSRTMPSLVEESTVFEPVGAADIRSPPLPSLDEEEESTAKLPMASSDASEENGNDSENPNEGRKDSSDSSNKDDDTDGVEAKDRPAPPRNSHRLSWSLKAIDSSGSTSVTENPSTGEADGGIDQSGATKVSRNRLSLMLDLGSPGKGPQQVKILAAVPEQNSGSSSHYSDSSSWPLKILAPDEVPENAEVLAVIAEEDDEATAEREASNEDESQTSGWPMVVASPGLPPMRMIGLAGVDEDEDDEAMPSAGGETSEPDGSSSTSEMEHVMPLRIVPRNGQDDDATVAVLEPDPSCLGQPPYEHGPIRLNKPEDVLRKGSITDMGMFSEDSTAVTWQRSERALIDGILDFFVDIGSSWTSEAACGAEITGGDSFEDKWLFAPLLDNALIQQHARGDVIENFVQEHSRPPPLPPPPAPSAPPALPPAPKERPDSEIIEGPPSQGKSVKGRAKAVHAPSFGAILMRRNLF